MGDSINLKNIKHVNLFIKTGELKNNNIEFLLEKLESTIKYTTIQSINEQGLDNFIKGIKEDIKNISFSINTVYFSNVNQ